MRWIRLWPFNKFVFGRIDPGPPLWWVIRQQYVKKLLRGRMFRVYDNLMENENE